MQATNKCAPMRPTPGTVRRRVISGKAAPELRHQTAGLAFDFQRAQAVEMGQPVAVLLVALVMVAADVVVLARVADEGAGDVRRGHLRQPAARGRIPRGPGVW